jgi:hypothetical protein
MARRDLGLRQWVIRDHRPTVSYPIDQLPNRKLWIA